MLLIRLHFQTKVCNFSIASSYFGQNRRFAVSSLFPPFILFSIKTQTKISTIIFLLLDSFGIHIRIRRDRHWHSIALRNRWHSKPPFIFHYYSTGGGGWNLLTKMPEIGLYRIFTFSGDFRHRSNREPGTDSVPRELPCPQHRPEHGAEGGASPDILSPPPPTAPLRSLNPI